MSPHQSLSGHAPRTFGFAGSPLQVGRCRTWLAGRRGAVATVQLQCLVALLGVMPFAEAAATMSFIRVTDSSNPIVVEPGADGNKYYGASWVDYDGDGDIDLFRDPTFLYRNDGGGSFVKITTSGIGSETQTTQTFSMEGSSWADADNDGDLDAFLVGEVGVFYRNQGGSFTPVLTGDIGTPADNLGWACAWADYDNDGWVDLMVTNPWFYISGDPRSNHLFHNDGTSGPSFTRVLQEPIDDDLAPFTVATWADYDDDGDADLFIGSGPANGAVAPDYLYRNLSGEGGPSRFERITDAPIATDLQDGQVWNWIDYDNDGDLDAYLTNYVGQVNGMANRLYRQESDGSFTAITGQPLVSDGDADLASIWADFDNDGDLDCFTATDGAVRDRLYENNGDGTFVSRFDTPLTVSPFATRGATAGDYDDDGDLDLFVYGPLAARALYENTSSGNHWATFTLIGVTSNRSAIGARVRAKATLGGVPTWQRRDVSAQNSFQGQNDLRVHFGLLDATSIDSLEIRWPSGVVQVLEDIAVDAFHTIVEPSASAVGDLTTVAAPSSQILATWPTPFTDHVSLRTQAPADAPGSLAILDVSGRLVRRLAVPAGRGVVVWDGRNGSGEEVATGVYWTRIEAGGSSDRARVVKVR